MSSTHKLSPDSLEQQYDVASTDVELKVDPQADTLKRFGNFKHKKYPNMEGGIQLETLLFSLFYPCTPVEKRERRYSTWFPKINQMVDGFLRMARRSNPLYRWVGCGSVRMHGGLH
jgi:platelet-activating factor acetylhydrolase